MKFAASFGLAQRVARAGNWKRLELESLVCSWFIDCLTTDATDARIVINAHDIVHFGL